MKFILLWSLSVALSTAEISSKRCGPTSWEEASKICGQPCKIDEDCDTKEKCYGGLPEVPCADRCCGKTWEDASAECTTQCAAKSQCPTGEDCFAGAKSDSERQNFQILFGLSLCSLLILL